MGLGRPDRLADGAAMGSPLARIMALATGWEGIRTATVSRPAVVASGIRGSRGRIIVSGPGQNRSANLRALSGTSRTTSLSAGRSAMCTISGLSFGRPLTRKMVSTAAGSRALAARP